MRSLSVGFSVLVVIFLSVATCSSPPRPCIDFPCTCTADACLLDCGDRRGCTPSCQGTVDCRAACTDDCNYDCTSGNRCSVACGANCHVRCNATATCDAVCGAGCRYTCSNGGDCSPVVGEGSEVDCHGVGTCDV